MNSTFKWNGFSNYVYASDSATTVSTYTGGGIYAAGNSSLTVIDSTFNKMLQQLQAALLIT